MLSEVASARGRLPIHKVNREGLSAKVVDQLQDLIFEKHLRSGDRLPGERELCEQFGVSRTVIREATKVLAQRGLLTIEPGRGSFITLPDERDIARSISLFARARDVTAGDLAQVRRALEPEIVALAASRTTETLLQALQHCIEIMDATLDEPELFIQADQEFHSLLAEATGNQLLLALTGVIVNLAQHVRRQMFIVPEAPVRGQVYHRRILASLAAGDAEGARAMMLEHLTEVEQYVNLAKASLSEPEE
jgi:GntR family transcriptional repressor for pyruvate dehydrogenase complex